MPGRNALGSPCVKVTTNEPSGAMAIVWSSPRFQPQTWSSVVAALARNSVPTGVPSASSRRAQVCGWGEKPGLPAPPRAPVGPAGQDRTRGLAGAERVDLEVGAQRLAV